MEERRSVGSTTMGNSLNVRSLGRSGLVISELGYGAWGIGGIQWTGGSDAESLRSLRRAFELGLNFVDTALAYGDGHSEQLVGRAIKEAHLPIIIATKIPPKNRVWPASSGTALSEVFPKDYMFRCTEQSLRNLKLDTIDLQQLHVWNPLWTHQNEWRDAFAQLKQSGKVRCVGVSVTEHDPDSGIELVQTGLVDSLQVLYNIFDPTAASQLFPAAHERGVGILARVPLDEGGLTGNIRGHTVFSADDFRAMYFRGDRKHELEARLQRLEKDLEDCGGTLPEIAIRFCISHPAISSVIVGMRELRHVESNLRTVSKGPLSQEMLELLHAHEWTRNFYE